MTSYHWVLKLSLILIGFETTELLLAIRNSDAISLQQKKYIDQKEVAIAKKLVVDQPDKHTWGPCLRGKGAPSC